MLRLGAIGAIASLWDDPSKRNLITTAISVVAGDAAAPMLAFADLFEYVAENSSPGPKKVYNNQQLAPQLPSEPDWVQELGGR